MGEDQIHFPIYILSRPTMSGNPTLCDGSRRRLVGFEIHKFKLLDVGSINYIFSVVCVCFYRQLKKKKKK
jgi:hypothetical protein